MIVPVLYHFFPNVCVAKFLFLFFNKTIASDQNDLNTRRTQHTGDVAIAEATVVMENPHSGEATFYTLHLDRPSPALVRRGRYCNHMPSSMVLPGTCPPKGPVASVPVLISTNFASTNQRSLSNLVVDSRAQERRKDKDSFSLSRFAVLSL